VALGALERSQDQDGRDGVRGIQLVALDIHRALLLSVGHRRGPAMRPAEGDFGE
jgi:hypothetical protein